MGYKKTIGLTACALLITVSCSLNSGSPGADELLSVRETSERIIQGDIADLIGQGDLSPVCPEVQNPLPGTVFQCSANASENRIVYVNGLIENDGRVSLATSNVLIPNDLPVFEQAAVSWLDNRIEGVVPSTAVDCGTSSIILNANKVIRCRYEPTPGDARDIKIRINDLASRSVEVEVQPQS